MGRTSIEEIMMAKYLLLKHYRGAPAPVNNVSGSAGALLRRRPLRTVRATHRGTRLKQPAWAGRHRAPASP
jgi:hypothetical protein